ncbi:MULTISPECIES: hypothetical protein [unclassified Chitinophaga]|uniref:hypothetical protein n=1 Tax=unclassified Chitinophaga TaxID=2619133 RepID=UPI00300FA16D
MKKIISISFLSACPASVRADDGGFMLADGTYIPDVIIRTVIIILLFYVATSFLLTLIRMLLNHRLKSKMISRGIDAAEAEKMLRIGAESKDYAMKWFLLLLSAGIGLTVIGNFPFGWLSVATVAFSLSLGFAGYYYYLKKRNTVSPL